MKVLFNYILVLGVVLVGANPATADEKDKKVDKPNSSTVLQDTVKRITEKQVGDTLVFDDYDEDDEGMRIAQNKGTSPSSLKFEGNLNQTTSATNLAVSQKKISVDSSVVAEKEAVSRTVQMKVYPNPCNETQSTITIQHSSSGSVSLSLIDITGKNLKSWETSQRTTTIAKPATGIYFIRLHTTEGEKVSRILVR